jgi:hypothetical protein
LFAALSFSAPARAQEPVRDDWRFEVTNVSSIVVSGDNRDTRSGQVDTLTNDGWTLAADRLDTQATQGPWAFSLRLDGAYFLSRPDPTQVGLDLVDLRRGEGGPSLGQPDDPAFFRQKVFEAGSELSNRYINWIIPAKYAAQYRTKLAQITVAAILRPWRKSARPVPPTPKKRLARQRGKRRR